MQRSRIFLAVALAFALHGFGCGEPAVPALKVPEGLALDDLPAATRALLRATMEISHGALAETDVVLDPERLTLRGDFALQNVGNGGARTLTLRIYGRAFEGSEEVLLGQLRKGIDITPQGSLHLELGADDTFEDCAPWPDGRCSPLFDVNSNGDNNNVDLHAGIDPGEQAPFLQLSPGTLQFPSGLQVGSFARQVVVVENDGDHPIRVQHATIVGGQGFGASLFDPTGTSTDLPRRELTAEDFGGDIAPNAEVFVAVTFAPVNGFLTTGALQLVVQDTITGVPQAARVKLIANPDGALRPADPAYVEPVAGLLTTSTGDVPLSAFPRTPLFSGDAVIGTGEAGGLPLLGGLFVTTDAGGAPLALPVDAAFAVDVPAGFRFSVSLAGLATNVDLALVELDESAAPTGLACDGCASQNAGDSAEAAEIVNTGDTPRRVALVLGRREQLEVLEIEGGLSEGPERAPFQLTATLAKGPEFDGAEPISPQSGPLEGGIAVVLRGSGFQQGARVLVGDAEALESRVVTGEDGISQTITFTCPPGSFEAGKNPATVVVQNPSVDDGGDGQAATLPEGFLFQPPAPVLAAATPPFASTQGGGVPIAIEGRFFSNRFGPPVVLFGNDPVDAFYESPVLLTVIAPERSDTSSGATVPLVVKNRLAIDVEGEAPLLGVASNSLVFSFVVPSGAAPTLDSIDPGSGSIDGGDDVVLRGTGIRDGARVLFDSRQLSCDPPALDQASIRCETRARDAAGAVDVALINADGQGALVAGAFVFEVPAPAIDDVFPPAADAAGGTVVIISGSGFRSGVQVRFVLGGDAFPATSLTRVSSTTLLAVTPQAVAGAAQVLVENPDGQVVSDDFSFVVSTGDPPAIFEVDPASGSAAGGDAITIVGENLQGASVSFGSVVIRSGDAGYIYQAAQGDGAEQITVLSPPASSATGGIVNIQVLVNGRSATTPFTYFALQNPAPRIDRISPQRLTQGSGDQPVDIVGEFFDSPEVYIDGRLQTSSTSTDRLVTLPAVDTNAIDTGFALLTLVNRDGKSSSAFVEIEAPASLRVPRILSVSLPFLHADVSGERVMFFGENLDVPGLVVSLSGAAFSPVDQTNALLIADSPTLVPRRGAAFTIDVGGVRINATAPRIDVNRAEVFDADQRVLDDGTMELEVFGDALNPSKLDSIRFADEASADILACDPLVVSETYLRCRTLAAVQPGRSYGLSFSYALPDATLVDVVPIVQDGRPLVPVGPFDVSGQYSTPSAAPIGSLVLHVVGLVQDNFPTGVVEAYAQPGDILLGTVRLLDPLLNPGQIDVDATAVTLPPGDYSIEIVEAGSGAIIGASGGPILHVQGGASVDACGDGFVSPFEGCDDGATASGDGCSSTCQVEGGFFCTGVPSVCTPTGANPVFIDVDTFDDEFGGGPSCSVREALEAAASQSAFGGCTAGGSATRIRLPSGAYSLMQPASGTDPAGGDLDVFGTVTLECNTGLAVLDQTEPERVLEVHPNASVLLQNIIIVGGAAVADNGGGIFNRGILELASSEVSGNFAAGMGGGIFNGVDADLMLDRSLVADNFADGDGGGLYTDSFARAFNSTFANNGTLASGGAISLGGGGLQLYSTTIAGNNATSQGGGLQVGNGTLGVDVESTVLADNTAGALGSDCDGFGSVTSGGGNLVEADGCSGFFASEVDAATLFPLDSYGGPLRTVAAAAVSRTVDNGHCDPSMSSMLQMPSRFTDMRGAPTQGSCDSGAYEVTTGVCTDGFVDVGQFQIDTMAGIFTSSGSPQESVIADFDGDGNVDIAVLKRPGDEITIHPGLGGGGFGVPLLPPIVLGLAAPDDNPTDIVAAEFDDVPGVDLAVSTAGDGGKIVMLYNTSTIGSLSFTQSAEAFGGSIQALAVANIDGDAFNRPDIVAVKSGPAEVVLLQNAGGGSMIPLTPFAAECNPRDVEVVDIDTFNGPDIVVACEASAFVNVFFGQGSFTFGAPFNAPTNEEALQLVLADINSDGFKDILMRQPSGLRRFLLDGNGLPPETPALAASSGRIQVADVTADGFVDVIDISGNSLQILRGRNDGTFFPSGDQVVNGNATSFVTIADVDSDGIPDFISSRNTEGLIERRRNLSDPQEQCDDGNVVPNDGCDNSCQR